MVVGSETFSGESCVVSFFKLGEAGSEVVSGKLSNADISGFNRNTKMRKTMGTYATEFSGFNPATIQLEFLYDVNTDLSTMISYLGSSFSPGTARRTVLQENSNPAIYKVKLDFYNYTGTFGVPSDNDEALKIIFYNSYGLSFGTTINADGEVIGNLGFQINPFNAVGSSNYIEIEKNTSDTLSEFNSAESSYDSVMGYS